METNEIWKDIPEYEGYYQVSNLGRVKSVKRIIYRIDGKIKTFKERILKATIGSSGYLVAGLSKDGKLKKFTVHKLVAVSFLGHKPCGQKEVVDHIDNNQFNNRLDNLQLTTQRHNASKDKKGGTSKYIGVCWHKNANKWMARIKLNGKENYLGYFTDEIEASKAYQNALKKFGGYNGNR
jgi:hypothetical protein